MKYPIRFGKYLLLERLNVGGMAEVFKAKAFGVEGFQRVLAIKRILPNMSEDNEFINMFVDEARLAVQLNHANIVQIYELGKHENQYYIAMEYVAGKDLRRIVEYFRKRKETMPVPLAAFLCSKICEGLDYAHRKLDPNGNPIHLVHRDVSPQNILVSFEGDVKVIDFGIAKAADRLSKTQAGVLKGKFGYMSPEQVSGAEIDRRSDLFAVGVLLYEMLTSQRLFVAETDFSTLEKVRQCDIPPLRSHNAAVPEALEAVVMKALAKDVERRYQWCSDFNEDLQRFLITDNSIFNSKRLAGFMKDTFREDIEAEMQRMQEYMRVQMEDVSADSANDNWEPGRAADDSTQIFELGDNPLASAETRVGVSGSAPDAYVTGARGGEASDLKRTVGPRTGSQKLEQNIAATQALNEEVRQQAIGARFEPPAHVDDDDGDLTKWVLSGAVVLALLILGGAFWWTQVRKPPAESQTWISVQVDPPTGEAELYIDGQLALKGPTPSFDKIPAAPGRHEIKIVAKDYADWVRVVGLGAGVITQVPARLQPAAVVSPTPASAPSPPPSANLPPHANPPSQANTAPPKMALGLLEVDSEPPGATIFLNGAKVGVTPRRLDGLPIGKSVRVELKRSGYKAIAQDVEVRGEERFSPKLTKEERAPAHQADPPAKAGTKDVKGFGFLAVGVKNEPDVKVLVDGRDTGRVTPIVPASPLKLAPGVHQISLMFKDGTKKSLQVVINPGETQKVVESK